MNTLKGKTVTELKVSTSSKEYVSAETMMLDEGGVELLIDGEIVTGGSFENLDNFELAYRVLPDDWEAHEEWDGENILPISTEDLLENNIYRCLYTLAQLRGWSK